MKKILTDFTINMKSNKKLFLYTVNGFENQLFEKVLKMGATKNEVVYLLGEKFSDLETKLGLKFLLKHLKELKNIYFVWFLNNYNWYLDKSKKFIYNWV